MNFKIIKNIFIFVSILLVLFAGVFFIRDYDTKSEPYIERRHVTELEKEYLKGIEAESCDGYWCVHTHDVFGYEAAFSGQLKLTEGYYNEIIEKYDDWEEHTGWPAEADAIGYRDNMRSFSCEGFKKFVTNETYLMSEMYNKDITAVMLLSKDSPELYMYFYTAR